MAIKNALRLRSNKTFDGGKLETLYSPYVERGYIYCIQQVAWEIDKATSGGKDRCRLYIDGHGYKHNLEEEASPTATALYTYSEPVWLIPGERLALDIDYADTTTTAEMCITGYWTEFKEGIVT